MMRRWWTSLTVVLVSLLMVSCAWHVPPNAAPETRIAIYADDAMKGVLEVQKLVASGESAGLIRTSDAAQVMIVAKQIGDAGERLSNALAVYHAAVDMVGRKTSLADVLKILDEMDVQLKALLAPLDATGEQAKLLEIAAGIVKAVWSIRVLLPTGGA